MIEFTSREHLQPSLLDRLTDDQPGRTTDPPDQASLSVTQLRQLVLRDLGWLFSTTRLEVLESLDGFPLTARSVLNYGLPGFAGAIQSTTRVVALELAIADAIRNFEPRILPDTLRVKLRGLDAALQTDGALIFEIEGELWAQPVPVRIVLETQIDPSTQTARITEARSAG